MQVSFTILRMPSESLAIVKYRLQSVVCLAGNVGVMIDSDSRNLLSRSLNHNMRLSMSNLKAFVQNYGVDQDTKTGQRLCQLASARKYKIIGIARVCDLGNSGQTRQTSVQSAGT